MGQGVVVVLVCAVVVAPLAVGASVIWSEGNSQTRVIVHSNGSYAVSLGGRQWLGGCVNQTTVTQHNLELTSTRTMQGQQPRLGVFSAVELSTTATVGRSSLLVVFTLKYFSALDLFMLEQQWPVGLELRNSTRGLAAAFPRFGLADNATRELSAVTWSGEMSGGQICYASESKVPCATIGGSAAASGFGEGADAPIVLFDSTGMTMVLSAFDQFGHQRSQVIEQSFLGWGPDTALAPRASVLPAGYTSRMVLHGAAGGVNRVVHSWGRTMQTAYGTMRKTGTAADPLTSRVGYWTDNVAFYDWYNYPIGLRGEVPEQIFLSLADEFRSKLSFKMAYWEYDVNYRMTCETKDGKPGPTPNCNMNCIYNWTTSNVSYNPHGLAWLSQALSGGWMFYLHMYCTDSPMWEQFPSIQNTQPMHFWGHTGVNYAQPTPNASFAFYDYLLSWGRSVGETAVFSDFLGDQTSIQQMNMDFSGDAVREWLLGFDAAANKHKMTMQMCMQLPSNLLQSLEMDSVTNARSSGDGGRQLTASMGVAFMLQSALGLGPSKDNVQTGTTSLSQAIVACLSKGPFGLGDELHQTNATVVMAASRGDGYILQPSRTITPVDRTYTDVKSLKSGQLWVADSHVQGFDRPWFHVLGLGIKEEIPLVPGDFYSAASHRSSDRWNGSLSHHFVYRWADGCLTDENSTACPSSLRPANGSGAVLRPTNDFEFLQFAPLLDDTTILVGEVSKFVPFSPVRFTSLNRVDSGAYQLTLAGAPGELVVVTCVHAITGAIHRSKVSIGTDGTGHLAILQHNIWAHLPQVEETPYDFTYFEQKLWPAWVKLFSSGSGIGEFSWLPANLRTAEQGTSLYGTTDMVYASFAVGQLQGLSSEERAEWARVINRFQNQSTGWYEPYPWEHQNTGNWPWHPTGAALEALDLLDCPSCAPNHPITAELARIDNRSGWQPFMDRYVAESKGIWGGSQQAQGLFAVMRSADPASASSKYKAFSQWYFEYLRNHSSPATGYWPGTTIDETEQLGGAFHLYKVHDCFGLGWAYPSKVVDTTLRLQNKTSGMWRTGGGGHDPGLSFCLDLDGVYSLTRSAQLAQSSDQNGQPAPYRWSEVKQACERYVKTTNSQLSNSENVLRGGWAKNSHLMHGALFAIAECALWFPELVQTDQIWQRAQKQLRSRSCMYA